MASRPLAPPVGQNRKVLDDAIGTFRADIANLGAHGAIDGATRELYNRLIAQLAGELRDEAAAGRISWQVAAERAQTIRNQVMERVRGRSTPFGRALAESIKSEGRNLNTLIAEKTARLYPGRMFDRLSVAERNAVYAEVVAGAGRSSRVWTPRMRVASVAGRALLAVSLAVAVYNIAVAEDHVGAAKKEGALLGGGILGGMAGGAVAGLACGPGAPVCVGIGAFVGGAMAAFGVSLFF